MIAFIAIGATMNVVIAKSMNSSSSISSGEDKCSQCKEITVHLIKQVNGDLWSNALYSAKYDPDYGDYGQIFINNQPYTVFFE